MHAFRIHVEKDYLGFCAGHFITYDGHKCEALHGHNYRARLTLAGPVDENYYVVDFVRIKRMMKTICDELDHRMLVALNNALLTVDVAEDEVTVRYNTRRYVFPRAETVLLPIPNTTAEMLAQHIAGRVRAELPALGVTHAQWIEIEVEESIGQSAIYRVDL